MRDLMVTMYEEPQFRNPVTSGPENVPDYVRELEPKVNDRDDFPSALVSGFLNPTATPRYLYKFSDTAGDYDDAQFTRLKAFTHQRRRAPRQGRMSPISFIQLLPQDDPSPISGFGTNIVQFRPTVKLVDKDIEPMALANTLASPPLDNTEEQIARFRAIVGAFDPELEDDEAPDSATSERAISFVRNTARGYMQATRKVPPLVSITPGPDGSIDVVWQVENRVIGANLPASPTNVVAIYAKDKNNSSRLVRGVEDPQHNAMWMLEWLT